MPPLAPDSRVVPAAANRQRGRRTLLWVGVALALVWVLGPLYIAGVISVKPQHLFFRGGFFPFFDFAPTLDHWRTEFAFFWYGPGMGPALVNSSLVGVLAATLAVGLAAAAAWSLVWRPPRHFALVMLFLLLPRLAPPVLVALPYTRIMQSLGLSDSRVALVVAHTTLLLPWALPVLWATFRGLSPDLLDAARLDGAGEWSVLSHVVLPLSQTALLAAFSLCLALSWMEYPFAVLNMGDHITTVPVAVAFLFTKDGIEFEYVGSHLLMALLPPMLLGLAANRVLTRAFTLGVVAEVDQPAPNSPD